MSFKKQIAAFLTTFAALLAGIAFAAWTATGTGNGYAKAGTAQNLTFDDISATVTATLYPGVSGAYQYQIHNPNPYPVTVTNVASNSIVTVVAQTGTGCTPANSGVSYTAPGSVSISIPANSSSALQTVANGASMDNTSVDACQGATFGLSLTATGQSG